MRREVRRRRALRDEGRDFEQSPSDRYRHCCGGDRRETRAANHGVREELQSYSFSYDLKILTEEHIFSPPSNLRPTIKQIIYFDLRKILTDVMFASENICVDILRHNTIFQSIGNRGRKPYELFRRSIF